MLVNVALRLSSVSVSVVPTPAGTQNVLKHLHSYVHGNDGMIRKFKSRS